MFPKVFMAIPGSQIPIFSSPPVVSFPSGDGSFRQRANRSEAGGIFQQARSVEWFRDCVAIDGCLKNDGCFQWYSEWLVYVIYCQVMIGYYYILLLFLSFWYHYFIFLLGLTGLFWNTEDLLGFWGSRFGCWGFGSWLCRPRRLRRLNARVTQRPSNRYSFIFSSPSPSVSLFLCDSIYWFSTPCLFMFVYLFLQFIFNVFCHGSKLSTAKRQFSG